MNVELAFIIIIIRNSDAEDGSVVSCTSTFRRLRTAGNMYALIVPRLIASHRHSFPAEFYAQGRLELFTCERVFIQVHMYLR